MSVENILLKKNNIVLSEIAEVVAQNALCETPNHFFRFRGACIGSSLSQECDYGCRRAGGWKSGSCKNQKCVCACWTSPT